MIDHYEPDIVTAQDYYPFGMLSRVAVPNDGGTYRFGFNGKENDNEVKGLGNQQDYGMRIYDPRVGRFYSIDPLQTKYPWYTPYQFAGNTPIQAKDIDGLEPSYPYQDSRGQWRETHAGDNLSMKNIPAGHEQYLRNSFSLNTLKVENEEFSHALNFVPLVGEIKGIHEAITGKEWFTGRPLSRQEQMMALLPIRGKGVSGVAKSELKQVVREEAAVAKAEEKVKAAHGGIPVLKYELGKNDLDWRGQNKTLKDALDEAFRRTGVKREEFKETKWAKNQYGKSIPVEYRAKNGAEVSIDNAHISEGPDAPHVGWQTPGKRNSGGAQRGHIILDEVPAGRSNVKE